MTLKETREIGVRTVDPDTLVDIKDVTIDMRLPRDKRLLSFVAQIKNPYCYKCGKAIIKVSFADTEATLEDRLEQYILSL